MELSTITKQTMSSREIAELTGKRHDHVLRDIDVILKELQLIDFKDNPDLGYQGFQVLTDSQTKRTSEILLNKELTYTLITGYNVKLRNTVIKRWQELEAQQPTVPKTYLEALKALVVETEAHEQEKLAHNETKLALEDKTIQLDESKEWLTIKRVAAMNGVYWETLSWRLLKARSIALGKLPIKVFDSNYETGVNAYHKDAWAAVYPDLDIKIENCMGGSHE